MTEKLVRDRIPEIMMGEGQKIRGLRTLPKEEFDQALGDKLLEEANEVLGATTVEQLKEEMADCLQVLYTLTSVHGMNWDEIEAAASIKFDEKGGFTQRYAMEF